MAIVHSCAVLICWATLSISAVAAPDCEGDCRCPKSPDGYVGYKVKSIALETVLSIKTPLGFLFPAQGRLQAEFNEIKQQLPLKENAPFNRTLYGDSLAALQSRFASAELAPGERIRIRAIIPTLRNCHDASTPGDENTVEVVYRIYTTEFLYYFSQIFQPNPERITRSLAPTRLADTTNKLLPQPFIGYNASRGLFGGTRLRFETEKGLFNKFDLDTSVADSSATVALNLSGSRSSNRKLLDYAEWRLAYAYANLPAEQLKLKEGTVTAQFFGTTQPLGEQNTIFRYGASIEGGNRQTESIVDGNASSLPDSSSPTQARYGALKFYLGTTYNHGRNGLTASYGLQVGSNDGSSVDYLKHIVDTGYSARFLWREHRPFRVDSQFTFGFIQSASDDAPIVERFFGGNVQRDFIEGDSWQIRSNPVIRSFPQNRFGRLDDGLAIGGKNFFSFNLTVGQTIWQRAAVPEEVLRDPDLPLVLGGGLRTARTATLLSYLNDIAQYRQLGHDLILRIDELTDELLQLKEKLRALAALNPPQEILDTIEQFSDDDLTGTDLFSDARDAIAEAKEADQSSNLADKSKIRTRVRNLAGGKDPRFATVTRMLSNLSDLQDALNGAGMMEESKKFDPDIEALAKKQTEMQQGLASLERFGQTDLSRFQSVREKLRDPAKPDDAARILDRMSKLIDDLKSGGSDDINKQIKPLEKYANGASLDVSDAVSDPLAQDPDRIRSAIATLIVGFGRLSPPTLEIIADEINSLQPLAAGATPAQAEKIRALATEGKALTVLRGELISDLKKIAPTEPERKSARDIDYTVRSLDVVFREMNLYAVSPIVIFDAARIGPAKNPNFGGTRYGLGAGVRFSLVSLDLNMGYAWNLNRHRGEDRGAFVFSLDISDLFR